MSNNKTFEALQEIDKDLKKLKTINEYVAFCKYNFKLRKYDKVSKYNDNDQELKESFPFLSLFQEQEIEKLKKKNKNADTTKDFPLAFLKEKVLKSLSKTFKINYSRDNPDNTIQKIQNISGIITDKNNIKNLIENLPKYSFAVWVKFRLLEQYFSRDDDEFYIISNPILKEKVFKIPMIRGSGWKGSLASAFKELINEKKEVIDSYLRIFGAGSDSIKTIEDYLQSKNGDLGKFKEKLLEFILFELGMKVDKNLIDEVNNQNSYETLKGVLHEKISEKIQKDNKDLPIEFQTHKGRAIFYPTYFDRLSLEVINPHDRRKRAGTQPIYYEVVPEGAEGLLQIIYIPFDAVLKENNVIKKEAEKDLENLLLAIEKVSQNGIGAKTKLGWGTFELKEKYYCTNGDIEIDKRGWEKCQS